MTQYEYDTEEKAKQALQQYETAVNTFNFCPLLQGQCRKDCECYVKAHVRKVILGTFKEPNVIWKVYSGYCANAMFCGE